MASKDEYCRRFSQDIKNTKTGTNIKHSGIRPLSDFSAHHDFIEQSAEEENDEKRGKKPRVQRAPLFYTDPPRISNWWMTPDQSRSSIFKESLTILDIRGVGPYKDKGCALIGRMGVKIQSYRVLYMHIHFSSLHWLLL